MLSFGSLTVVVGLRCKYFLHVARRLSLGGLQEVERASREVAPACLASPSVLGPCWGIPTGKNRCEGKGGWGRRFVWVDGGMMGVGRRSLKSVLKGMNVRFMKVSHKR